MNQKQLQNLARKIIETNQYMTIGSRQMGRLGWVSPVAYAHDDTFNFYFVSLPHSNHAKNFRASPRVTAAIFDSHQPYGEGIGLQIEGRAKPVSLLCLPHAVRIYFTRKWPYVGRKFELFLKGMRKLVKNKMYRVYQFTPTKVWMNDPESEVDRRVEVQLS